MPAVTSSMFNVISTLIVKDNVNVGGTKVKRNQSQLSVPRGAQDERLLPLPSDRDSGKKMAVHSFIH